MRTKPEKSGYRRVNAGGMQCGDSLSNGAHRKYRATMREETRRRRLSLTLGCAEIR